MARPELEAAVDKAVAAKKNFTEAEMACGKMLYMMAASTQKKLVDKMVMDHFLIHFAEVCGAADIDADKITGAADVAAELGEALWKLSVAGVDIAREARELGYGL